MKMKMEHLFKMLKKIWLILLSFYNDDSKDFLYVSFFTIKLLGGGKGRWLLFLFYSIIWIKFFSLTNTGHPYHIRIPELSFSPHNWVTIFYFADMDPSDLVYLFLSPSHHPLNKYLNICLFKQKGIVHPYNFSRGDTRDNRMVSMSVDTGKSTLS